MNHIARTRRGAERSPGLVIMGIAVLAFVVCVVNFALGAAGAGVVAASVGLLAFGAGLAWLVMDGRRFRDAERGCGARRRAP
ncbi:LapA family protein [Mycobacterium paraense]|uniref:hypothetical protein n=1 Tax=Mycobacterium paraense TaxID=767916 RepID=UPI000A14B935|nr:hypothetical protein [Mycobacterium paraense]MCV7442803.1 LapA family protein [Mycobacterium paraense]ORW46193.1 hypothetical protein AWB89_14555 [Mycobacterium paraense]